jgi:hypothetical protein
VETGTPFTVTIPGDPLGENNGDPFQYPDRSYGPGCKSAVNPGNPNQYVKLQCFSPPKFSTLLGNEGRNTLTGPGRVGLDISLSKNIPIPRISETFKTQFRADFFNIINHANFTSPNDNRAIMDSPGKPDSLRRVDYLDQHDFTPTAIFRESDLVSRGITNRVECRGGRADSPEFATNRLLMPMALHVRPPSS